MVINHLDGLLRQRRRPRTRHRTVARCSRGGARAPRPAPGPRRAAASGRSSPTKRRRCCSRRSTASSRRAPGTCSRRSTARGASRTARSRRSKRSSKLTGGGDERVRFMLADALIDLGEFDRAKVVADGLTRTDYAQLLRGRILLDPGRAGRRARGVREGSARVAEQCLCALPRRAGGARPRGLGSRDLGAARVGARQQRRDRRRARARAHLLRARPVSGGGRVRTAGAAAGAAACSSRSRMRSRRARWTELGQPERARKSIETLEQRGFASAALRERIDLEARVSGPASALAIAEKSRNDLADPQLDRAAAQVVDVSIRGEARRRRARARRRRARARPEERAPVRAARARARRARARRRRAQGVRARARARRDERARDRGPRRAAREGRGHARGRSRSSTAPTSSIRARATTATRRRSSCSQSGDADAAAARLREIVKRHPGAAGARNDLAWLLASRGEELDLALRLAVEAQRRESSPSVLDTLGWVHYQRGEYADAVTALEAAVARAPDSPSIRYRLGRALQQAGNPARARRCSNRRSRPAASPKQRTRAASSHSSAVSSQSYAGRPRSRPCWRAAPA